MNDPKDLTLAHLIVAAIDTTRALARLGHDVHAKDLQDMWTKMSAINNSVIKMDEHQTRLHARMLCMCIKAGMDTIASHYKE